MAKFFDSISRVLPGNPLAGKEEAIARLDPNKIYVENVRRLLGVSAWMAQKICETAVRQGLFRRYIEVSCPDGSIAATAETESELPEMVQCWAQRDGEFEEAQIPTILLRKTTFYRIA
ncbi:MAG: hypothetical protein L0338_31225 [Acidobacteria bacterium]|nr:hypothetical protein [Acidobacteriota bacterium]